MIRSFLLGLMAATSLPAAMPDFAAMTPAGGQRGTDTKVTINGARLEDFEGFIFYSPGFTTKGVEKKEGGVVVATIGVDANVPNGPHALRLRTRTGVSYLRQFYVGPYPNVMEAEPNSEFTAPQVIGMNQTVNGVVTNEDVDYYKVTAKAGQRIAVEVEGVRLGYAAFDPYVSIMNAQRFDLAASDDTVLHGKDCHASIVAPADGDYIIQVREAAYQGNDQCRYRLHVGDFRRPEMVYPAGGKAGGTVQARFIDHDGSSFEESLTLPAVPDRRYPMYPKAQAAAPSGNVFRVMDFDNVMEVEPNNDAATATLSSISVPVAFNGIIDKPDEVDMFKIPLKAGMALDIQCFARSFGSPLDSWMQLTNAKGEVVSENDDTGEAPRQDSRIKFTIPADGEYCVRIFDHLNRGGPDFAYRIEMIAAKPEVTFSSPQYDNNNSQLRQLIPIPKGGRFAQLVNVSRSNTGGDMNFQCEGLPAGVRLVEPLMPGGLNNVMMLFEAAPDAPLGGAAVPVTLKPGDPNNAVVGRLNQVFELVREGNNLPLHTSVERALPVAVVEEAPYSLEILKPLPLLQAGVVAVKVSAKRKEGFKAPIRVLMMWRPPGINGLGEQTIPEGQTECVFMLDANGDAPVATWKLTVLGEADGGSGPIYNASPFTELAIAPMALAGGMPLTAVEQGKGTDMICKLEQKVAFEGEATAQLIGLPDYLPVAPIKITKGSADAVFKIATKPDTRPDKYSNLFVQVDVPVAGGTTVQRLAGGATLRVDPPPPPPKNPAPAPVAAAPVPPPPPQPAAPKALTRLEQLRQQVLNGVR